ncbi:MAG: hypothetical protein EOP05_12565 [Proteobacteria bacterium]|nr:MAG: hypothetical protein EOP05_12565 [Pseudomonadota bacterium]
MSIFSTASHAAVESTKVKASSKTKKAALATDIKRVDANPSLEPRNFTPHLTLDSRTRDAGKVSFQRAPGANINTGFFLSSFTVAVTNRVEVGTMPIFYTQGVHRYNYNVKVNVWRSSLIDWALGYSQFSSKLAQDPESTYDYSKLKLENTAAQISFNLHPEFTRFILSCSYIGALTQITGNDMFKRYSSRAIQDLTFDLSYPVARRIDVTVGGGSVREIGFSAYEERRFGFGASTGIYFPKQFISKVALGSHYTPETRSFQTLFGLQFL